MRAKKTLRNAGLLAATGLVALALTALPVATGLDAGFAGLKAAQAKGSGNGNGNAGGNGGGNGNGNGNGIGNGQGGGVASASANGHGKSVSTENHDLNAQSHGLTASSLGNLNAAHASETAMSHASINSVVGQIGAAVELAAEEERSLTADDLVGIANKDVDDDVVAAVNGLVDGKDVDRSETVAPATDDPEDPDDPDDPEET